MFLNCGLCGKQASPCAGAAITKYGRLGGTHNKDLFFTFLDVGKAKIKVLLDLVFDKESLPGL